MVEEKESTEKECGLQRNKPVARIAG